MKIIFAILLGLHALLHFLGGVKAFQPQLIPQLSRNIGTAEGILWLLDGLLLLSVLFLLLSQNGLWAVLAVTGALLSQLLIGLNWSDAKYGTLINLLIFAVAIPVIAHGRFQKMASLEVTVLRNDAVTAADLEMTNPGELPEIVQKWLDKSGAAARPERSNVKAGAAGKNEDDSGREVDEFYCRAALFGEHSCFCLAGKGAGISGSAANRKG